MIGSKKKKISTTILIIELHTFLQNYAIENDANNLIDITVPFSENKKRKDTMSIKKNQTVLYHRNIIRKDTFFLDMQYLYNS